MEPDAGEPVWRLAVHATAVSIGGRAVLIVGPSKAGKSRLALALIDASTSRRRIRLIGDDRVLLSRYAGGLLAKPHPRTAGFLERRGLGIVAMAHEASAPVAGIVDLGCEAAAMPGLGARVPTLSLADRRWRHRPPRRGPELDCGYFATNTPQRKLNHACRKRTASKD